MDSYTMDSQTASTLTPQVDYETTYWASKLGIPVERITRFSSGSRGDRTETATVVAPMSLVASPG